MYGQKPIQITPTIAAAMLMTFNKPERAGALTGVTAPFCSNAEYMDSPYVCGGVVRDGDDAEVYLSWEGIEGIDDVTDPTGGYSFTAYSSEIRNWQDTARVAREHLKELAAA